LCVRDFASLFDYSIGFWNSSGSVEIFCFSSTKLETSTTVHGVEGDFHVTL